MDAVRHVDLATVKGAERLDVRGRQVAIGCWQSREEHDAAVQGQPPVGGEELGCETDGSAKRHDFGLMHVADLRAGARLAA